MRPFSAPNESGKLTPPRILQAAFSSAAAPSGSAASAVAAEEEEEGEEEEDEDNFDEGTPAFPCERCTLGLLGGLRCARLSRSALAALQPRTFRYVFF
jgi:hypothetical protein